MKKTTKRVLLSGIGLISLMALVVGCYQSAPLPASLGAVVLTLLLVQCTSRFWKISVSTLAAIANSQDDSCNANGQRTVHQSSSPSSTPSSDAYQLVEEMLQHGRQALLLRPQIVENLDRQQQNKALQQLDDEMSLVPEGQVVLGQIDDSLDDGKLSEQEIISSCARIICLDAFYLDRYQVTNLQYYNFVAAGGYEQMGIWDPEIWPGVIDFIDHTNYPGPKLWKQGKYPAGKEKHPVVGISWYEAQAYARWVGKRLATDAQWVKAGSWPVVLSEKDRLQRRFPWGNSLDSTRANLWANGPGTTLPVYEFSAGASVGGIYGLIGNVWEWTEDKFKDYENLDNPMILPTPMRSVRGGAFDTYFENQATCQFQSADNPVSRRHNIGFRCVVGLKDLTPHSINQSEEVCA